MNKPNETGSTGLFKLIYEFRQEFLGDHGARYHGQGTRDNILRLKYVSKDEIR